MLAGALLITVSQVLALSILAAVMMALGMGVANAAVFKLVPKEVPQAVGGAAGWVGGLGAFGGFAIPPILSAFVRYQGNAGYTTGFVNLHRPGNRLVGSSPHPEAFARQGSYSAASRRLIVDCA
jgi:nitrate/nitrite transporter NarK